MEVEDTMTDQAAMAEVGVGLVCSVDSDAKNGWAQGVMASCSHSLIVVSFPPARFSSFSLMRCFLLFSM
jgi:hypothetical protein